MPSRFIFGARTGELPEVTVKAFEKLKEAVTKEGLVLSLNERRQEGGSKMIAS